MFRGFSQNINLPLPNKKGKFSLEEILDRRRSIREFSNLPLSLEELSQILWASYGVNRWNKLTSPSAGALYPLVIYVVVGNVKGLEAGLYKYDNKIHSLILINLGDFRKELSNACLGQSWVKEAPINIIVCANYGITTSRYGERGKRYVDIETGHVGQNIYLEATALNLATVAIGAFYDDRVKKLLSLKEEPLYIFPVGRPK
ncbi:MAG: SagB/ThcOx family dehydrogenase [Candidatus Aenigmatarchaeota archaeon]